MVERSTQYATALALAYGGVASAYIIVSSSIAADHAATIAELLRIETIKGVLFVVVTMAAVFGGALLAMRRMARDADELVRREHALLASQGRVLAGVMAASIAHDANNLLTIALADLDEVGARTPPAGSAPLAQLRTSIDRLIALNRRLRSAHDQDAPRELRTADLARLVRDSVATVRLHASLLRCRVVCRGEATLPTVTQPVLVHQIVTNLLINAGEAAGVDGLVEVDVRRSGEHAIIEVQDSGPGVPAARRANLFDALESTKPHGAGLGLFSVRACALSLGGDATVGDSALGGACFRVRLPTPSLAAFHGDGGRMQPT
jgi:signal transduction histidine kinase